MALLGREFVTTEFGGAMSLDGLGTARPRSEADYIPYAVHALDALEPGTLGSLTARRLLGAFLHIVGPARSTAEKCMNLSLPLPFGSSTQSFSSD